MASRTILAWVVMSLVCLHASATGQELLPRFNRSDRFREQIRWDTVSDGVRVFVMAPEEFSERPRELIVYATPNGSTIEQTLGCRTDGTHRALDRKYDLQHIAAQVRCYRESSRDRDVILAVVQAPQLSWPAYRRGDTVANDRIRHLVDTLREDLRADRVILSCHSGGGAFLWAWMNAHNALPDWLHRLVFLDANYSYSDEDHHGDKMIAWLRSDPSRHLIVLAYDDREITSNGRKVIDPGGGTYRATERMIRRFTKETPPEDCVHGNFLMRRFLSNQATFTVHRNPDNRILHTALVGDMNGLIYALTIGQVDSIQDEPRGPRAFDTWISAEPFRDPAKSNAFIDSGTEPIRLDLPSRSKDAPIGTSLTSQMASLTRSQREDLAFREIMSGNVPQRSRMLVPIRIAASDRNVTAEDYVTMFATGDYLAIGSDDDFIRMPLTGQMAARLAHALNCVLPTTRMADHVAAAADVRLEPRPMTQDRESMATFVEHSRIIDRQLTEWKALHKDQTPRLIGGIRKDVVITTKLAQQPDKVAIYGWMSPDGTPIQPLYIGHSDQYVDYSHGVRLVWSVVRSGQHEVSIRKAFQDEELSPLLSSEGPFEYDQLLQATYLRSP